MSIFSIEVPDGQVLDIEAGDQATAVRGAQEWFAQQSAIPKGAQPAADTGPKMGMLEAGVRSGADSLTFGWSPEVGGALGLGKPEDIRSGVKQAWKDQPVASGVGALAGAAPTLAIPGLGAARGASLGAQVLRSGLAGAGIGALSGAGAAGPDNRVSGALEGGGIGLGVGAVLPPVVSGVGKLATAAGDVARAYKGEPTKMLFPPRPPVGAPPGTTALAPTGEETVNALDRLKGRSLVSGDVNIPIALASDNLMTQRAGQIARNTPFGGEQVVRSVDDVVGGLGAATNNISGALGSGDRVMAGTAIKGGIERSLLQNSSAKVSSHYAKVDALIDDTVGVPLTNTQKLVAGIAAERNNAALPFKEADLLSDALSRPAMNYQGIKMLRTRIGEMLDTPNMLPSDMSGAVLKRFYGSLTDDLKGVIRASDKATGKGAFGEWQVANAHAIRVAKRSEDLAKVINVKGDASPELVAERIYQMATDKASGNVGRLANVRQILNQDEWSEMLSMLVGRMGRDKSNVFTPDRFVTAWGSLSDPGKKMLFQGAGARGDFRQWRKDLDDVAVISRNIQDKFKKFGNPSGTAQNLAGMSAAAGLVTSPLSTLSGIVGGSVLARKLASPADAKMVADWTRMYQQHLANPNTATQILLEGMTKRLAAPAAAEIPQLTTSAPPVAAAI